MADVTIYASEFCGFCWRAKKLLESKGVDYREVDVDMVPGARQEMMQRAGRNSVPQIFVDDRHIGGCDDLYDLDRAGKLDDLLRAA